MPKLTMLVGPPGSGKSTLSKILLRDDGSATVYVNGDSQGGSGHLQIFLKALEENKDILCDRMNFNREQRARYLILAKKQGYQTKIIVLHEPYEVCLQRIRDRFGKHETVNDEKSARSALKVFFTKYERPTEDEADEINFIYPKGQKRPAIYSDLDGTLCDVAHRRHHVQPPEGQKKNWKAFFEGIADDPVNKPVMEVLRLFCSTHSIVYCTGRDDNYRKATEEWLHKHGAPSGSLYMRNRYDSRKDSTVKEILLDFEILTRYDILFCLDDRDQVVEMLRGRGFTVFQVAKGDF